MGKGIWVLECEGVGGPDDDGDNGSVTQSLNYQSLTSELHIVDNTYRRDRVATIFATVWAKVDPGFT